VKTILNAAGEVLAHGEALLREISDSAYSKKIPLSFDASVGGHYRHCLDHFDSLLSGLAEGIIDYDARLRNPRLETDRLFAIAKTAEIQTRMQKLPGASLWDPVSVRCKVAYSCDDSPPVPSAVAREVMFCVSHAIHHYAIIGVMADMQKMNLPPGFGIAPSTLKHNRDLALAAG